MKESPTQYRGWVRCPGSVLWHSDKLPYWCITSAWEQDRHGVYYRQYIAMYHGQTVHEIQRSSSPRAVIDAVELLLAEGWR